MEEQHLLLPLLSTVSSSSSSATAAAAATNDAAQDVKYPFFSNKAIILRLLSIVFIGIVSIYASYEDSRGFEIVIVNDSKHSPAGKRFDLFYVSNDKATRIIQNTSSFVQNILYPAVPTTTTTNHPNKQVINSVTLRFSSKNLTRIPTVEAHKADEFVINISPSIMGGSNVNQAITSAIQHGMARVWLWDCKSHGPAWLVEGLVEYISRLAGFGEVRAFGVSWEEDDKDPRVVAQFLDHCEQNNKGFIQWLNQAMREGWDGDYELGMQSENLCDYYEKLSN